MTYQKKFMLAAVQEAEKNLLTNAGGPFGAVLVKDGEIVGRGHNQVLAQHDPTCHAEIQCIRDACAALGTHDLSGCELYTSCYPCPMCLAAIIWANIKTVYYGNTAKDADAIGFRDDFIYDFIKGDCHNAAVLELTEQDREECNATFRRFAAKPDKTIY